MSNDRNVSRLVTGVVGIVAFVVFGYATNPLAAVALFVAIWMNNFAPRNP